MSDDFGKTEVLKRGQVSAKKAAPGPWTVGIVAKQTCYVVDGNGNLVIQCHDGEDSDAEATAKLVSAAPDLLAALQEAHYALTRCYDVNDWPASGRSLQDRAIQTAAAAIAKATGAAK